MIDKSTTVQSFLRWFEKQANKKIYLKIYSDASGFICEANSNSILLKFENALELYQLIQELQEALKNKKKGGDILGST